MGPGIHSTSLCSSSALNCALTVCYLVLKLTFNLCLQNRLVVKNRIMGYGVLICGEQLIDSLEVRILFKNNNKGKKILKVVSGARCQRLILLMHDQWNIRMML